MKRLGLGLTFILLIGFINFLQSQSIQLSGVNVDKSSPLNKTFFEYKVFRIQYDQLKSAMASRGNEHILHLQSKDLDWNLDLFEHSIYAADFVSKVGTDHGVITSNRKPANTAMIGYLKSERGGQARMVVAENYIAGMVEQGGMTFFIEPANGIDPSMSPDYLVVYNTDNIIPNTSISCGFELYKKNKNDITEKSKELHIENRAGCYQVEIAISNDFTVFQKRGSQAAVENWNTTILTLMGANYDNEFASGIEFVQTASFVALSSAGDPWNGINDINSQLDQHQSWGSGGGYGAVYDIATNWTTKFKSGAVGLAWVGTVCTNLEYNVCSDYGGSNNCVRQLEAHETGHNFNCQHDGSGAPYIMAPAVNCSTDWSSTSIAAVNAFVKTRGCLSACSSGSPPVADFYGTPTEHCVPFNVQFTDLSTNDPTSWQWTFPGGTPSASTLKNPSVQYKVYGMYDVTLKVTNNFGNSTVTFKQYIFAEDKPVAKFSKVNIERYVYLTNLSLYGNTYEWDFGDGETSNDVDPVHEYANDGVYTITLRAENDCGINETKMNVTIVTSPIALFTSDTTKGCASFKVKYINLSSKNVTSWEWDFPGGTPSTSTLFEPVVEYKIHGVFDVRLTAKNSKYTAKAEKLKYITSDSLPVSAFDTVINKNVVTFTNKSSNAQSWIWDFGDNTTSTELNPSHSYLPGTYQAKLTVNNNCGSVTIIKQIDIAKSLLAGFKVSQPNGCIPYTVQFTNTSFGATSFAWTFPGGTPSASTDTNPVIVYNTPGSYDVSLTAKSGNDSTTYTQYAFINVEAFPEADFKTAIGGSTVYFSNQSKYGKGQLWDFGDGKISNENSPSHVYTAEGEYQVKLVISNNCGNDTLVKTVAVYLIPKVDFLSDTTLICGSGNIQFKSKTSSDVNLWSWQFDGGEPNTSDEKNPSVYYAKKGTYTVKLTVRNSNGENELIKQSYIRVISTVLCPDTVYYKYELTNDKPINQISSGQSANPIVYPNPFNGKLNIQGNSESINIKLELYDLLGRELYSEILPVINGRYQRELNLEFLNEGSYLIHFNSAKESITKTIFLSK